MIKLFLFHLILNFKNILFNIFRSVIRIPPAAFVEAVRKGKQVLSVKDKRSVCDRIGLQGIEVGFLGVEEDHLP